MDIFEQAIAKREVLSIDYPPGRRLVEPHAYGRSSERKLLVRVFQVEGASESGEHKDWKLLRVDRLEGAVASGQTFDGPRPGYKRAQAGGCLSSQQSVDCRNRGEYKNVDGSAGPPPSA